MRGAIDVVYAKALNAVIAMWVVIGSTLAPGLEVPARPESETQGQHFNARSEAGRQYQEVRDVDSKKAGGSNEG